MSATSGLTLIWRKKRRLHVQVGADRKFAGGDKSMRHSRLRAGHPPPQVEHLIGERKRLRRAVLAENIEFAEG
jgi:hypothetical protein